MKTDLRTAIRENEGLLETTSADEVIRYIDEGNLTAAGECLSQAALLQESCMNQGRADAVWALCDRLGEAVTA